MFHRPARGGNADCIDCTSNLNHCLRSRSCSGYRPFRSVEHSLVDFQAVLVDCHRCNKGDPDTPNRCRTHIPESGTILQEATRALASSCVLNCTAGYFPSSSCDWSCWQLGLGDSNGAIGVLPALPNVDNACEGQEVDALCVVGCGMSNL